MSITNLSIEQLKQAISIKEEIAALEQKLASLTGAKELAVILPKAAVEAPAPAKRGRKTMSPEAKAKIAAAATARWAKIKGTAPTAVKSAKAESKAKRVMSPEGRARIIAAVKARWAAKKK